MNWYYVNAGQQTGPVDEAQLDALWSTGQIGAETLVWREGMANWQPYREARPSGTPGPVAGVGGATTTTAGVPEAVCAECGRIFPIQDTIQFANVRVCAGCKPIFMQKLAEGAKIGGGALNYAGFWVRFGAKFLDGLIIGVPFIVGLAYIGFKRAADSQPGEYLAVQLLLQFGMMFVNLVYQVFFLGKYGATPGKMACHLKVVTSEGAKIGYGRAAGRFFAEMLSAILCYIGYLIAAFDSEKRALHDRICNTRVIITK
jgi:uncharacterized RDD family membrane protein YckC